MKYFWTSYLRAGSETDATKLSSPCEALDPRGGGGWIGWAPPGGDSLGLLEAEASAAAWARASSYGAKNWLVSFAKTLKDNFYLISIQKTQNHFIN